MRIPHLFSCNDKTKISSFYLCDDVGDCNGKEDEKHCHLLANLLSPLQLCDIIITSNFTKFPWSCPFMLNSTNHTVTCNNNMKTLSSLTFNLRIPGKPSFSRQSESMDHCVHIPSVCGIIDGNSSGYHLISCENHTCPSIYFKCPGYYCLPWRFVCNGQWECPGGMEEIHCNRTACPGLFKCRMSNICISHVSICDNISDCPLNDDQHFCDRSLNLMSCPTNCSCLVFSLFCQELTLNVLNNRN